MCYRLGGDMLSDLSANYRLGDDRTGNDNSPEGTWSTAECDSCSSAIFARASCSSLSSSPARSCFGRSKANYEAIFVDKND